MTTVQAILFGVIQGFTEFLPVSSSGHLALAKELWGLQELSILFDILLHVASLLAVLIVFRKRIGALLRSLFHFFGGNMDENDAIHLRLIGMLLLATLITGVLGIFIERVLSPGENIRLVSSLFMVTALILIAASRAPEGTRDYSRLGLPQAIISGLAQGLGVFPGISRAGITISAGQLTGLRREEAGEFSFLLSIPAILGAALLKIGDLSEIQAGIGTPALLLGMASSFIAGYLALTLLMGLVRRGKLWYFAFYLIPLGLAGLFLL